MQPTREHIIIQSSYQSDTRLILLPAMRRATTAVGKTVNTTATMNNATPDGG